MFKLFGLAGEKSTTYFYVEMFPFQLASLECGIINRTMNKIPKVAPNLKQEVKKLYREIFRSIRKVPDENNRNELRDWARSDFKSNKHHTDEIVIKMMLQHGRKSLKELQESLALSKNM